MRPPNRSATDPRIETPTAVTGSVAPVVALPRQGLPPAVLFALAVLAAIVLFMILNSRRAALMEAPETTPAQTTIAPPPPLYVPVPVTVPPPQQYLPPAPAVSAPFPVAPRYRPPTFVAPTPIPQPNYYPQPPINPQATASGRMTANPALVIDTTAAAREGRTPSTAETNGRESTPTVQVVARSRAGILANRSMTVPQGTLIPAVLETGFNSTWPGFARAIVSRDVRGFDGTRVLIPRGSRVVGEYGSDATLGQKRAMVNWTRLVRPDGAVITIGSPSADSLGQGGIPAKVNTHFFQRFASAILQTAVDVGASVAGRRSNSSVIVAMPGGAQAAGSLLQPSQPTPTLTVRPGTSITIFVARDLEFSGLDRGQ